MDPLTLVICWADRVKVCKVRNKNIINQTASNSTNTSKAFIALAATAASSGAIGLANVLSNTNDKKDLQTYVEIGKMLKKTILGKL